MARGVRGVAGLWNGPRGGWGGARRMIGAALSFRVPPELAEIGEEQARGLVGQSLLYAGLGLNTTTLILLEFWPRLGPIQIVISAALLGAYAWWLALALGRNRGRCPYRFIAFSTRLLALIGGLWAAQMAYLSWIADPDQRAFVIALTMGLVSTSILGAPLAAALAFWIPTVVGAFAVIASRLQPFDTLMTLCFSGYVAFTLLAILFLNRTVLERSIVRARLARQDETVRLLLREYEENAADWLWELDASACLVHATPRFAEVMGTPAERIVGRPFAELLRHREVSDEGVESVLAAIAHGATFRDRAVKVMVGGEWRWWLLAGRPTAARDGRLLGYRGVGTDVTEVRRSQERVNYLASHDSLTGLCNRRAFLELLEAACERALASHRPFALFLADLDRFKEVNDGHGHAAGDAVLVAVSRRLRAAVREHDVVARLGGDEFAVLVAPCTEAEALVTADRLIAGFQNNVQLQSASLGIGASLGLALFPQHGRSPKEMLSNADIALYQSKGSGRGVCRVFSSALGDAFQERVRLQTDLREAVLGQEIGVEYQAIVDLATDRIVAMEALARWTHPTLGLVPPTVFVPVAESCGLIGRLGAHVLSLACADAVQWRMPVPVAVNLSPLQLRDAGLVSMVAGALRDSGLDPSRLELELTESAWVGDEDEDMARIKAIIATGVRFVMDDFGSGYATLAALLKFPFCGIKISADLIGDIEDDRKASTMLKMVASLAAELAIDLTAEGIETAGQIAIARRLGIRRAQGFLLHRPLDPWSARALLAAEDAPVIAELTA